jgi:hypothetical protein
VVFPRETDIVCAVLYDPSNGKAMNDTINLVPIVVVDRYTDCVIFVTVPAFDPDNIPTYCVAVLGNPLAYFVFPLYNKYCDPLENDQDGIVGLRALVELVETDGLANTPFVISLRIGLLGTNAAVTNGVPIA